jgi:hypothetical protein
LLVLGQLGRGRGGRERGDGGVARLGALLHGVPLLLGGVVGRRRGAVARGVGRGGGEVEDCDEADGGAVEGEEPDGEDLEDVEVEG